MLIETRAYARAGLIGNPSDGYFGKTISFTFRQFFATITLWESPEIIIELHRKDHTRFGSLRDLVEDVKYFGYYGGLRLIKAALKRFWDYCQAQGTSLPERNFAVRYDSSIPIRVGLAGSSAIIVATLRALCRFYGVEIPKPILANLALSVETQELHIPAGLQDRVAQVYQGLVYMDFSRTIMEEYGYGRYEELELALLPPLYIAYLDEVSLGTEVFHTPLRQRWEAGDPKVRAAMVRFAEITDAFREAMEKRDLDRMDAEMNANFDLRASIVEINEINWQLINTARNVGASSKLAGAGGAAIGIWRSPGMLEELRREFGKIGAKVIVPEIAPAELEVAASPPEAPADGDEEKRPREG